MSIAFTSPLTLPVRNQLRLLVSTRSLSPRNFRSFSTLRSTRPLHSVPTLTMSSSTEAAAPATPTEQPSSVSGPMPIYAQCMLRINNPEKSGKFYEHLLGMKAMTRFDFPKLKFSLFFYAYCGDKLTPSQSEPQRDRAVWLWSRPEMTVELTWNWPASTYEDSISAVNKGAEPEENFTSGNEPPKGFGYIQISVQDVPSAIEYLRANGVSVLEEPTTISCAPSLVSATVADPDGYHVRLVGGGDLTSSNVSPTPLLKLDPIYSSVMLRVKDISKAVPFFRSMGFNLIGRQDDEENKCTDFYLSYLDKPGDGLEWACKLRVCTLTLRQEWGVDQKDDQPYTNGNTKPYRGYGHVGIIVDDIYYTMGGLESRGYKVARDPGPFADVGSIGFIVEPSTDYWVEVISRTDGTPTSQYEQVVMSQS